VSERVLGFAAGIAIRLLIKNLRIKRKRLEEMAPPQLTREEIDQYIVDTTIDEAYEQLQAEYDKAYHELLQREKEIEDPHIKKLIQKIKRRHELFRPKNKMEPSWMLTAILLNEALKHGVKDRDKIYQYILKASWEYAKQIAQILPTRKYQGKHQQAYADQARNPYKTLSEIVMLVNEVNKDDPIWRKYINFIRSFGPKIYKRYKNIVETHHEIPKILNIIESAILEAEKEAGIEPFWHKTPEEILGVKTVLSEEYASYRRWLVNAISSAIKAMDPEELAEIIVSCCGGECIYNRIAKK